MTNVLEYLEQSAEKYPEKTAFADEENSCTWQELKERAQRIGSSLAGKAALGAPIAVWMEKSVDAIAAFMGIVYAGCFYVMLDKNQPNQRIMQILDTLEQPFVIADEKAAKITEGGYEEKQILPYKTLAQGNIDAEVLTEIRKNGSDVMPLYGIFTSGSTGVPKGVVVSHRSVLDFMDYFTDNFGITSEDVIGNQAPFDFDVSVKDIYSALKTGAAVQLIPKRMFSFPTQLLDFLCERKVTTLIWAVSALCMVSELKGFTYRVPELVNKVLFSGEVMPVHHLNIWRSYLPDAMYVNLYGPTEITCNCTYYIVDREFAPGDVLPIGKPFQNEKVFLLDEQDKLVEEPGLRGEICVSGTALSLGYYNNEEQTRKAFVQNPLNCRYQEVIYRTGDLGYYNEKKELCYATRKDFQIKHMGHRIELGEIEQAMEKTGEVSRACCLFDEDSRKIVAFYEGTGEKRAIVKELRKIIPPFMIPNAFCKKDGLPLTKNGKIDRAALKKSYQERQEEQEEPEKQQSPEKPERLQGQQEPEKPERLQGQQELEKSERLQGQQEEEKLKAVLEKYQTPAYVFDLDALARRVEQISACLKQAGIHLCYAMKANPFVVGALAPLVERIEVCSPGEFRICEREKLPMDQLVVSGVNKEREDIRRIVTAYQGQGIFTIESESQRRLLSECARETGVTLKALVRLTSGNQFGVDWALAKEMFFGQKDCPELSLIGIQYYSGTQKKKLSVMEKELQELDGFCRQIQEESGIHIEEIEYGPGFFVPYFQSDPEEEICGMLEEFASLVERMEFSGRITLEMGRFLTAGCGSFFTSIVDRKENAGQIYGIVDGGIHHLNYFGQTMAMKLPYVRHIPIGKRESGREEKWNICGSLCTTADVIVKQFPLAGAKVGDVLVFEGVGAYSMTEGIGLFLSRDLPKILFSSREKGIQLVRDAQPTDVWNSK